MRGIARDAIDGVLVMMPAIMGEQHGWAARVAAYLGIEPTFSATMDMGGATACGSVQTAIAAIDAGYCTAVLCCFATQNWPQGVAMQLFGSEFQVPYGDVGAITLMGHIKRRQQHEHGYTEEHYGQIAVTWREHALLNPDAQMKKPMTLDDYLRVALGGRAAAPLRLLPEHRRRRRLHRDLARARPRPRQAPGAHPRRRAVARHRRSSTRPAAIRSASRRQPRPPTRCTRMAGVQPTDIDCAQLYDAFTPRVDARSRRLRLLRAGRSRRRSSPPATSTSAAACRATPPAA